MKKRAPFRRVRAIDALLPQSGQAGRAEIEKAHDVAAGEPDDTRRRDLYRQIYQWCIDTGRWHEARVFAPFTGWVTKDTHRQACFQNAIAAERAHDALALAEEMGPGLELGHLQRVWAGARATHGDESFVVRAIAIAIEDALDDKAIRTGKNASAEMCRLLLEAEQRRLTDFEELALGLARRAYAYLVR